VSVGAGVGILDGYGVGEGVGSAAAATALTKFDPTSPSASAGPAAYAAMATFSSPAATSPRVKKMPYDPSPVDDTEPSAGFRFTMLLNEQQEA
jgi:hypothetical protein